jgi:hypothetical protein
LTVGKGSKCDLTVPAKRDRFPFEPAVRTVDEFVRGQIAMGIAVFHRFAFRNDDVESDLPRLSRSSRKNILFREG